MRLEEQIYFSSRDLENLSSSVMYSFDPSRPFKSDMMSISRAPPISISEFSPRTDFLEDYKKEQEINRQMIKEMLAKQEEERQERIQNQKFMDSITSYKSKPLCSASNFGLGPGVAKETEFGYIERYLPPHKDEIHGEHINLGSYFPGSKKPFLNIHIDLNDDE